MIEKYAGKGSSKYKIFITNKTIPSGELNKNINKNCKVLNNKRFTNTRMDGNKCTYNITSEHYEEFLKYYTSYVFDEENEEFITEKHEEIGPIVIDLDFRFRFQSYDSKLRFQVEISGLDTMFRFHVLDLRPRFQV